MDKLVLYHNDLEQWLDKLEERLRDLGCSEEHIAQWRREQEAREVSQRG